MTPEKSLAQLNEEAFERAKPAWAKFARFLNGTPEPSEEFEWLMWITGEAK